MRGTHILTTRQFDHEFIDRLFEMVDKKVRPFFEKDRDRHPNPRLAHWGTWDSPNARRFDYLMGTIFCQPSTRTRMSFESAMKRLGGNSIDFGPEAHSSVVKGETWQDTAEVISQYCDVLCVRTQLDELPNIIAERSDVPVINCGSGRNEHPTQALLDLYTIKQLKGKVENLNVVIFGDIENARTIASLKQILSLYPLDIVEIDLMKRLTDPLDQYIEIFKKADVVYITRMQKEWHGDLGSTLIGTGNHRFTEKTLTLLKDDAIVMHPGPVVDEVTYEVRKDPRWVYKQQVKNGLYVRMALLKTVLGHH